MKASYWLEEAREWIEESSERHCIDRATEVDEPQRIIEGLMECIEAVPESDSKLMELELNPDVIVDCFFAVCGQRFVIEHVQVLQDETEIHQVIISEGRQHLFVDEFIQDRDELSIIEEKRFANFEDAQQFCFSFIREKHVYGM